MKALEIPLVRDSIMKRKDPDECYIFWENLSKGFSEPFRDITREDVTFSSKSKIKKAMEVMLTEKRNRLLIKLTGWSRIGFLREVFPDAKFIHILRDARAVVNSLLNVTFWAGWKGPHNWRWGVLSEKHQRDWERYDQSFAILAAIEWVMQIDAIEKARKELPPSQFLEIKYENMIAEPTGVFEKVIDFCELEWTNRFRGQIESFDLKNMNYKWEENLPESQKNMLNEFLHEHLKKHGYN